MRIVLHLLAISLFCIAPLVSALGWHMGWLVLGLYAWGLHLSIKDGSFRELLHAVVVMNWRYTSLVADKLSRVAANPFIIQGEKNEQ